MTLPASGPITLGMVAAELGIGLPLTLGDSRVRALAGVPSGPISLGSLRGKTAGGGGGGGGGTLAAIGVDDTTSMANNANEAGGTYSGASFPRVIASGGTGSYSYEWSITTGSGYTLLGQSTATPTVKHSVGRFGFDGVCVLACVVTDGASSITVNNIQAVYSA